MDNTYLVATFGFFATILLIVGASDGQIPGVETPEELPSYNPDTVSGIDVTALGEYFAELLSFASGFASTNPVVSASFLVIGIGLFFYIIQVLPLTGG